MIKRYDVSLHGPIENDAGAWVRCKDHKVEHALWLAKIDDMIEEEARLETENEGLRAEVERLRAEAKRSHECLSALVYWHDVDGRIDESWFDEAREILAAQKGGSDG